MSLIPGQSYVTVPFDHHLNWLIGMSTFKTLTIEEDLLVGDDITVVGDTTVSGIITSSAYSITVKNDTAGSLPVGTLVYINGNSSEVPTVAKADAVALASARSVLGMIAGSAITIGGTGTAVTNGLVSAVNTTGIASGTVVYLAAGSPGTFTSTAPTAPNYLVPIGRVVMGNSAAGSVAISLSEVSTATGGGGSTEGSTITVINDSGGNLIAGDIVYVNGESGGVPSVDLAIASSLISARCILGVVSGSTFANGASGTVTINGLVGNLDTQHVGSGIWGGAPWVNGAILYLSEITPGQLTITPPVAPNYIVPVARVAVVSGSAGSIVVSVTEISSVTGGGGTGTDQAVITVENNTGGALVPGDVVYVSGESGGVPEVTKAIATEDPTATAVLGVVSANIADTAQGTVVIAGLVENANTSTLTGLTTPAAGDTLYLSPTDAGQVTNTMPGAPYHVVPIGRIVAVNATTGSIAVAISDQGDKGPLTAFCNGSILEHHTVTVSSAAGTVTLKLDSVPSGGILHLRVANEYKALDVSGVGGEIALTAGTDTSPTLN